MSFGRGVYSLTVATGTAAGDENSPKWPLQLHHVASSLPSLEIRTPTGGPPALFPTAGLIRATFRSKFVKISWGKEVEGSLMGTFLEEGRHCPGSLIVRTDCSRFFSPFAT